MVICGRCATESPDTFRFCPGCGAPLPDVTAAREALAISQAKVTAQE